MAFDKVDTQVDFPAQERAILDFWQRTQSSRTCGKEPRQAEVVVPRRAHHRQQPDGRPPRLGPHLQGRLPALLRHDRPRAALPERLRLPGPVGRSRGRKGAGPEVQARHRKPRPRRPLRQHRPLRPRLQGAGGQVRPHPDRTVDPPGLLDGLGPGRRLGQAARPAAVLLHHVGGEQLHDLDLPEEMPRAAAWFTAATTPCRGARAAASA